jgi:hypothetical protein
VISATENSNKFQKTRFWKEKSVEDVVTLGPMAQATLVDMKRQINMFLLMSMIFILILIKFYIGINNEELLKTI